MKAVISLHLRIFLIHCHVVVLQILRGFCLQDLWFSFDFVRIGKLKISCDIDFPFLFWFLVPYI